METLRILDWVIEVDTNKTRSIYAQLPQVSDGQICGCVYCRNWVKACAHFTDPVNKFFQQLGIDPTKEGEIYQLCIDDDSSHLYGGFYHFVGRLILGPDCMVPFLSSSNDEIQGNNIVHQHLTTELKIGFTRDISLRPKDNAFPEPILQLEFAMNVPWVLGEEPKS